MSEWIEAPLSQLVTFQKGRKVDTSPFAGEGFAAYLGASGIEGSIDGYAAAAQFAVIAKPTDTLMLWDGERSGLVGFGRQGVVASTVSKLSPNEKIEPQYLYFALSDRFAWIQHRRTGTGVPHVPKDLGRILKLRYPKSPLVQKRIAAILAAADTAIEKTEALIVKYQQIKIGLMHDLFTRGVLPNGQLRPPPEQTPELYQETAIGWIPREWEIISLGSRIESNLYGPRFDAGDYDENGNVKTIRGTDFSKDGDISYSQVPIARLSDQKINRHILKTGDVIVVTTADCGLTAVFEEQKFCFIPSAYAVKYRFANTVNPHFIKYFMQTNMAKRLVHKYVRQGTLGNLPGSDLLRFLIGLPPIGEQATIVLRIESVKRKIALEQQALDKLMQQKLGLMQDLLTGKVPVRVDALEA